MPAKGSEIKSRGGKPSKKSASFSSNLPRGPAGKRKQRLLGELQSKLDEGLQAALPDPPSALDYPALEVAHLALKMRRDDDEDDDAKAIRRALDFLQLVRLEMELRDIRDRAHLNPGVQMLSGEEARTAITGSIDAETAARTYRDFDKFLKSQKRELNLGVLNSLLPEDAEASATVALPHAMAPSQAALMQLLFRSWRMLSAGRTGRPLAPQGRRSSFRKRLGPRR